jgi:tRNA-specific 2-thiouridylase
MKKDHKKVILGMSGGVDSSLAAALLKKDGFEVTGVFMRLWKTDKESGKADEAAAREVAKKIGIKFRTVSARKFFHDTVIKYFLTEYARGKTPNPCVFCNENLKFKLLFAEAQKLGAHWVATGHYAKIKLKTPASPAGRKSEYGLFRAKDEKKDQSYFLYRLKQKDLGRIIFPLGNLKKEKVRELAKELNLPVWEKKESQDVCFLSRLRATDFLQQNLKAKGGSIINEKQEVVGSHQGLPFYTLGQRKGIEIGGSGPYYVVGKNLKKNQLQVTNNPRELSLFSKVAKVEKANWISGKAKISGKFLAQTRYRSALSHAIMKPHSVKRAARNVAYDVEFKEPQKAVTPGQSIVFYSNSGEVLGGAVIA